MAEEIWGWYDAKSELAELIIPKLEAYKIGFIKEGVCIPSWLLNVEQDSFSEAEVQKLREQWVEELDKMLDAFKLILENKIHGYEENKNDKIQSGLDSFGKYFQHLWD